jgi:hypothetical protein
MELTVDLTINSATGELGIELVVDGKRGLLESSQAAKLAADLATVLAFTVANGPQRVEAPVVMPKAGLNSMPEENDEAIPTRVSWHRGQGREQGSYVADLGSAGKGLIVPDRVKGWNVKIGGKKINQAPISKAAQAKELVLQVLQDNPVSV